MPREVDIPSGGLSVILGFPFRGGWGARGGGDAGNSQFKLYAKRVFPKK
jgi:hypothetical protein